MSPPDERAAEPWPPLTPRPRRRHHAKAVYAHAATVGAPLSVTFTDPRDGARIVDALLAAADRASGVEARHWRRIAGRLGDALDRTAVPSWEDVDGA